MDLTIQSLRNQTFKNMEVLIADNCSTDNSVEIIKKHNSEAFPIKHVVNPTNIGFAGNLDKVGSMATADWMIMLSSDDFVKKEALKVYDIFINLIGDTKDYAFCSTFEKIDSKGKLITYCSPKESSVWFESDIDQILSKKLGFDVYRVQSNVMLRRCLIRFLNPFNFASTCYPREVYEKVGGYGGGRLYNPDKWFHWKIMTELDQVYYLDSPLFQYRWHSNNQANQQNRNHILKYWTDEYRNSFEIDEKMLITANLSYMDVQKYFIRRSILSNAFLYAKVNNFKMSKRILHFGQACYPQFCNKIIFGLFYTLLSIPVLNWLVFKILSIFR